MCASFNQVFLAPDALSSAGLIASFLRVGQGGQLDLIRIDNDQELFYYLVQIWHTDTHTVEACQSAKGGGERKENSFKLSPLCPVTVITDGVFSMQPTMLVSTSSAC